MSEWMYSKFHKVWAGLTLSFDTGKHILPVFSLLSACLSCSFVKYYLELNSNHVENDNHFEIINVRSGLFDPQNQQFGLSYDFVGYNLSQILNFMYLAVILKTS